MEIGASLVAPWATPRRAINDSVLSEPVFAAVHYGLKTW